MQWACNQRTYTKHEIEAHSVINGEEAGGSEYLNWYDIHNIIEFTPEEM